MYREDWDMEEINKTEVKRRRGTKIMEPAKAGGSLFFISKNCCLDFEPTNKNYIYIFVVYNIVF